jgi:hypothetical protein
MSQRVFGFLDEVLQRYFGVRLGSCTPMSRADLERLLTDDTQRRLDRTRLAAADWSGTEIIGGVSVTSECLLITPRGLLYAAGLKGTARRASAVVPPPRPVYYLATPPRLFEPIAERVAAAQPLPASAAAVDSRLGHDLVFAWPLDAALRRTLDAHEVLRLEFGTLSARDQ